MLYRERKIFILLELILEEIKLYNVYIIELVYSIVIC